MTRMRCLAGLCLAVMGICACDPSRVVINEADQEMVCRSWTMEASEAVDILFVVDNSSSMLPNQAQLVRSFPRLVEALRLNRLGGELPDVRVGVISTDLGARDSPADCKPFPGDGGRLRRLTGELVSAAQPWLAYNKGTTNVAGPQSMSPLERFKVGFSTLARLGSMGCSYEQPLESALRALDPAKKINPGFIRPDALLAVVFISNEDDCSVTNPQTFDFKGAPGFDSIHRCFHLGVQCSCPAAEACGPGASRLCTNCTLRTTGSPLRPVSRYINFLRGLKKTKSGTVDPGRVIVAALAGSTRGVSMCRGATGKLELSNVCSGSTSLAYPAFRLQAVVEAFSQDAPFRALAPLPGVDQATPGPRDFADICKDDFSDTLERIGERIAASLSPVCLGKPASTADGELACARGELVNITPAGVRVTCGEDTLYDATLAVDEISAAGAHAVPRCQRELFDPRKGSAHCGPGACPCWRLVPSQRCGATPGAAPHAVEILRQGNPPRDVTGARLCHGSAGYAWGSADAAARAPRQ